MRREPESTAAGSSCPKPVLRDTTHTHAISWVTQPLLSIGPLVSTSQFPITGLCVIIKGANIKASISSSDPSF